MKSKFICSLLLLSAIAFSFKPEVVKHHQQAVKFKKKPTGFDWSNGTISGNMVYIYIDRDDNLGSATVTFTGHFNSGTSSNTFTVDMGDSTHWEGQIQGNPQEVGDVYLDTFSIHYY